MTSFARESNDRYGIVRDAMQAWVDDFSPEQIEVYVKQINAALSGMMPLDDLYGSESMRHGELRHEVAKIVGVKIDRRSRANQRNAAIVDDVVDSFWYYTMAIRTIAKADPKNIWGFSWQSRCNERRQGQYPCQALDGREWQIGDKSMPLPVRDTGVGCNCLLFEVSGYRRSKSSDQMQNTRNNRSLLQKLFGRH